MRVIPQVYRNGGVPQGAPVRGRLTGKRLQDVVLATLRGGGGGEHLAAPPPPGVMVPRSVAPMTPAYGTLTHPAAGAVPYGYAGQTPYAGALSSDPLRDLLLSFLGGGGAGAPGLYQRPY